MRIRPHLFHLAAWEKSTPGDSGTGRASTLPARGQDKIATALTSSAAALPPASPTPVRRGKIKHINHHPPPKSNPEAWGSKGTCPRSLTDKVSTSQGPRSPSAGRSTRRDATTQHEEPPRRLVPGQGGHGGAKHQQELSLLQPEHVKSLPWRRRRRFFHAGSTSETQAAAPAAPGTSATCSKPSTSADASAWQSHNNCRE